MNYYKVYDNFQSAFDNVWESIVEPGVICRPADALYYLKAHKKDKRESFFTLFLDSANRVIDIKTINIGEDSSCNVSIKAVFKAAIELGAASILCAHNHPSGNLSFSNDDQALSKELEQISNILHINFIDHLVFSYTGYSSYKALQIRKR